MNMCKPYFSIIIPTYERHQQLRRCLSAITEIDYPRDRYEVIVVDDGSKFKPKEIVSSFRNAINISLFYQNNSGPARARNTGVKEAIGDFLAFTDDDCEPEKNWLNAFAEEFEKNPNRMLGGRTINSLKNNPYSATSQELVEYLYSYYNKDPQNAKFFTSNNMAINANLFREIGCFDVTTLRATAEDREMCDRMDFLGHKMTYVPQALVYHSHNLSFSGLCKQHFNYGRGAYYYRKIRAIRGRAPIKIEPLTFYTKMLLFPNHTKLKQNSNYISVLMAVSQIANACGFFWQALSGKIKNSVHA